MEIERGKAGSWTHIGLMGQDFLYDNEMKPTCGKRAHPRATQVRSSSCPSSLSINPMQLAIWRLLLHEMSNLHHLKDPMILWCSGGFQVIRD
jgi:hypothetical protein